MPKRRRERDRPKAGPEASHHPQKRVLLSYASDEEVNGRQEVHGAATANYEITPYPDETDAEEHHSVTSVVQQSGASLAGDGVGDEEEDVRQEAEDGHKNDGTLWTRAVTRNQSTGQWPALGSLSYQWDEDYEAEDNGDDEGEDYDSTEEEAMAYLRSVRYERQNLPSFFRAPLVEEHNDLHAGGDDDGQGDVGDETYVDGAHVDLESSSAESAIAHLQQLYAKSLKERFFRHRQLVHVAMEPGTSANTDHQHPTAFKAGDNKAYAGWVRHLHTTAPLLAQIRSMDQQTVFQLLDVVQRHHLARTREIISITSSWIWSLLARLDDVGTMDSDQVFLVRDFGKKAILVQLSFDDPVAAQQLESVSNEVVVDSTPAEEAEPSLLNGKVAVDEEGKSDGHVDQRLSSDETERRNTLATLDIIIRVVGDTFGQRDLLEFCRSWEVQEDAPG